MKDGPERVRGQRMENGSSSSLFTVEEARAFAMVMRAVKVLPKSDPRYSLVIGVIWWLLHRRRRLDQQRIRRRKFFRRWRRLLLLRWGVRNSSNKEDPADQLFMHSSLIPKVTINERENTVVDDDEKMGDSAVGE